MSKEEILHTITDEFLGAKIILAKTTSTSKGAMVEIFTDKGELLFESGETILIYMKPLGKEVKH